MMRRNYFLIFFLTPANPIRPRPRSSMVAGSGTEDTGVTLTLSSPVYLKVYSESAKNSIVVELLSAVNISNSDCQLFKLVGASVYSCDASRTAPLALAVRAAGFAELFHFVEE